jgi:hypothetical protein
MSKRHIFAGLLRSTRDYADIRTANNYCHIPLLRGFTEIKEIFELAQKHNGFICGGYARRCASPAPVVADAEDVDIYTFKTEDMDRLRDELIINGKFAQDRVSQFSITLKKKDQTVGDIKKIQLVNPEIFTNNPKKVVDILDSFDFNVCKCAIISSTEAISHKNFLVDETYKTLTVYGTIKNPVMLFFRIIKYVEKGYRVSPGMVIEMMTAIRTLQYKDHNIAQAVKSSVNYLKGKESGLIREFMFGNVFEPPTETNVETKKDEPF